MKTYIFLLLLCFPLLLSAQAPTQNKHHIKLELKEKEVYIVGPDNILLIDTLIMRDRSVIVFDPSKPGVLVARTAIIKNNCVVLAKGADGNKAPAFLPGEDGENGGQLDMYMSFQSLGKLTIDVRGGNGGPGVSGKDGERGRPGKTETKSYTDANGKLITTTYVVERHPGTDGGDATKGGNGGDGGSIKLSYKADSFSPVFNQNNRNRHRITILYTGGKKGEDGKPGFGGIGSRDGELVYSPSRESADGSIVLERIKDTQTGH